MTDDVLNLDHEIRISAQVEAQPEMVTDEQNVFDDRLELVRVDARFGETHAFRPNCENRQVTGTTVVDGERPDRATRRLDVTVVALYRPYLPSQNVVVTDEARDELARGFFVQGFRRSDLLDVPSVKYRDARRHRHRLLLIMGDVNDGHAQILLHPANLELHLFAKTPVQGAEWFVHQHQCRIEHQGAGNRDALLLATGEFSGTSVFKSVQTDHLECSPDSLSSVCSGNSPYLKRKRQVSSHRHVGKQGVILKYNSDASLARRQVLDGTT